MLKKFSKKTKRICIYILKLIKPKLLHMFQNTYPNRRPFLLPLKLVLIYPPHSALIYPSQLEFYNRQHINPDILPLPFQSNQFSSDRPLEYYKKPEGINDTDSAHSLALTLRHEGFNDKFRFNHSRLKPKKN